MLLFKGLKQLMEQKKKKKSKGPFSKLASTKNTKTECHSSTLLALLCLFC